LQKARVVPTGIVVLLPAVLVASSLIQTTFAAATRKPAFGFAGSKASAIKEGACLFRDCRF
jgi:hypothetical protein